MSSSTITSPPPPTDQGPDMKLPFRQSEPKADKHGSREDRDRRDYNDKDDPLVSESGAVAHPADWLLALHGTMATGAHD